MEEEWEFFEKLSKGSKTQASVDRNNNHTSSANFLSNQDGTNSEISELSKKVDLLLRNLGKCVPNVSQVSHNAYEGGDSSNFQQNYHQQSSYQQRPQQYQNHGQGSSNGQQSNVDQKFDLILSELAKSNQGGNLKFESLSKSVAYLERQMGQLAEEVHTRETGKLPSYPDLNPKHKSGGPEHVNMVTSLRTGKTYNNDIKIPSVHGFSHDVEDFVTDDEIVVEGRNADNVKSDSELVNDFLKDVPKLPTHNPEATESPKVGEGGVSSTTTPYPEALEKPASIRLAKKEGDIVIPVDEIQLDDKLHMIEEPDSLITGNEHLDNIPETKSDEFIKSSVENHVPNPNDDFSSSDNKSFFDEDIPKEIYSNPLFDEEIISTKIDPHHLNAKSDLIESLLNQDSSIISSSKIDSLLDEFTGGFTDKFVRDPNKTPYLSQRPPQDCPRCGSPVDGLYCRHCALLRKKLKEVWFTICDEHKFFQDFLNTSESSNDDSNVVSMHQEPVVFNQDPGKNSSQSPPQIDHHCYYGCGNSLDGPHETFQFQPMNYYKSNPCYDSNYSGFDNFQPPQPVIDHLNLQQRINDSMIELCGTFQAWLQQQKNQVCQKIPFCYDDEESSIPLRDIIISELPPCIAITPVVSTKDSFIMGNEHLDTIPETESDEFIKSSVENIIPNPSESEDERDNNESFSDEDIPKEIYSNPLFDEEIISTKIDPHHLSAKSDLIESLLNQDSSIISSSKTDSLLDEFAGELILLKSIPPGIDEVDYDPVEEIHLIEKLLYDNSSPRPPEEFIFENSDAVIKSFSPSPIPVEDSDSLRDEIDLSLTPDDSMPPGIKVDDYNSEGDIRILEELLSNHSLSLLENESFHFDIPSSPRPHAKPPDGDEIEPNSGILTVKVVGDISEHSVPIPKLLPTQPTHASNMEKSPHLLSHQDFKSFLAFF
nr:hypothetical protein [Tanacetum cinerariifolium]